MSEATANQTGRDLNMGRDSSWLISADIISVFLAIYIGVHFSQLIYPYLSLKILSDYTNIVPLVAFFLSLIHI